MKKQGFSVCRIPEQALHLLFSVHLHLKRRSSFMPTTTLPEKVVNSVNVRRFLSSMMGFWRECLESTGSFKGNPRRKRPVAHTSCKFGPTRTLGDKLCSRATRVAKLGQRFWQRKYARGFTCNASEPQNGGMDSLSFLYPASGKAREILPSCSLQSCPPCSCTIS